MSFDDDAVKIGRFRSLDYFGDGSFYLLHTPGHTNRTHMCALARTGNSGEGEFVLLGGDVAHHVGELRPSAWLVLPEKVVVDENSEEREYKRDELVQIHRNKSADSPFFVPADGLPDDMDDALWSIAGVQELDAHHNIMTLLAHDKSLLDMLPTFPEALNEWTGKDLKRRITWQFLGKIQSGG